LSAFDFNRVWELKERLRWPPFDFENSLELNVGEITFDRIPELTTL
jgi:hypothetical protein